MTSIRSNPLFGPSSPVGSPGGIKSANRAQKRLRAYFSPATALLLGLYVLVGCYWAFQTARMVSVAIFVFYAAVGVTCLVWGRVFLVWIHAHRYLPRSEATVFFVGCMWTSFVLAVVKILTPFRLDTLFWAHAALGIFLYSRMLPVIVAWRPERGEPRIGLATFFLCLVATTLWDQHLSPIFIEKGEYFQFDFFNENFSNGCNTMPLTVDGLPARGGSFQFAGESLSFYHWASYTLTALARQIAGIPIVTGQAAVWYPMGQVMLGLAGYALGSFWFRPMTGFWCVVALLVIPDPTYWWADVSALSFLRVFEASSAMLYTVAAAALTVIFTTLGARHDSGRCLAAGVASAFATAYFKVNIILMLFPLVLYLLLAVPARPWSWKVKTSAVVFVLLVGLAYLGGSSVRSAPTFRLDEHFGRKYSNWLADHGAGDTWFAKRLRVEAATDHLWDVVPRAVLVILATLQVWIVPWMLLAAVKARRPFQDGHVPFVPLLTIVLYGAFAVLLAPNENGDPFELQHRSFGWPYFLVVVWTVGEAGLRIPFSALVSRLRVDPLLVGYALLAIPLTAGRDYRVPHPVQLMERGYIDCLEYARTQTDPFDHFVDSRRDPWLMTVGMAERRTFMCFGRPAYNFPGHGSLAKVWDYRAGEIARLLSLSTREEILAWGKKHGIRWCILHPDTPSRWPQTVLDRARFQSGEHRVIDLSDP